MHRRTVAAAVAGLALLLGVSVAAPAHASTAGDFASRINSARAAAGRPQLTWRSDLADVAARHSRRMASADDLYHNPNLRTDVSNWQAVGENVGRGGDVPSLHNAFMNSPSHRANILDTDFTEVGVGTHVDGNGILWVTEVFRRPMQQTAAPKPKTTSPKPRTSTKPAPVRTPEQAPQQQPTQKPKSRPAASRPAAAAQPTRSASPARRPAAKPGRTTAATTRRVVAAQQRGARLQLRLAELTKRHRQPAAGALTRVVSYLDVMAALSR